MYAYLIYIYFFFPLLRSLFRLLSHSFLFFFISFSLVSSPLLFPFTRFRFPFPCLFFFSSLASGSLFLFSPPLFPFTRFRFPFPCLSLSSPPLFPFFLLFSFPLLSSSFSLHSLSVPFFMLFCSFSLLFITFSWKIPKNMYCIQKYFVALLPKNYQIKYCL